MMVELTVVEGWIGNYRQKEKKKEKGKQSPKVPPPPHKRLLFNSEQVDSLILNYVIFDYDLLWSFTTSPPCFWKGFSK